MDEPQVAPDQEPGVGWYAVTPIPPAKLAFEEWDGRVNRIGSAVLVPIPPCPICGANHRECDTGKFQGGK